MITIFKFYSDTCAPCKMLTERLASLLPDESLRIENIDVKDSANKDLVEECKITSVPVLLMAKREKFIRMDGVQPLSKIKEALDELRNL